MTFETRVEFSTVKGLVFGGVHSPQYLTQDGDVPYVVNLTKARLVVAESVGGSFANWVPFLEDLAKAQEALVVITPKVASEEVMQAFIVNSVRKAVFCCPIYPGIGFPSSDEETMKSLADALRVKSAQTRLPHRLPYIKEGGAPAGDLRGYLPLAERAWVRRSSSWIIPPPRSVLAAKPLAEVQVAVIHVGGGDQDEQKVRMRLLGKAIEVLEALPKSDPPTGDEGRSGDETFL